MPVALLALILQVLLLPDRKVHALRALRNTALSRRLDRLELECSAAEEALLGRLALPLLSLELQAVVDWAAAVLPAWALEHLLRLWVMLQLLGLGRVLGFRAGRPCVLVLL